MEAMLLMENQKDPRDINMFLTNPIELPDICKKYLAKGELVKLA